MAALVDDERDAAPERAQLAEGVVIAGRERLLDQLDAELDEQRQEPARLLEVPALVRIDAQRQVADRADRVQALEIAVGTELDLEAAEAGLGGAARAIRRAVDRVDPDRVGRLGRAAVQTEQLPGRPADELADEIVQRAFHGAAADDGAAPCAQTRLDGLERERVVAQRGARAVDEGPGRLDRLAVAIVGRALAAADVAAVADLRPDDALGVGRPARDRERLRERERADAAGDLHGAAR